MVQKEITVTNSLGLHARPCSLIVQKANQFRSKFKVIFNEEDLEVNGKSIIGMMTLAAPEGSVLTLEADGVDEQFLVDAIAELFTSNFGEE